jgi:cystathionine gamma-lyase/cystathionine beta-lyase
MNSAKAIEAAIRPNTRMIWFESPSNPLLNIVDIEMVAAVAKKHKILTVMDNTFATPYFLKPIEFGIDIVMHSTTKYLNGHSDVIGGALITSTEELSRKVQFYLNALGTCAAPFDCWLVTRGIATLAVRMKQHAENAQAVAEFLQQHPAVAKVYYPGLKTHPGHEIASRQMKGYGGMVSFEVKKGEAAAHNFLRKAKLFALAESLGGVASLAEYPALMSHASMSAEARQQCGITEGLVRLSVGIENSKDLIDDLAQALIPS